jgi:tyrosyl-tRNA synthetase
MVSETHILDELHWRGLVALSTDETALREALSAGPVTFYCGFDPTAPSLHMGNLVQLLTMRRLQDAGHRPLALVGGSTGLIGDPKPTSERVLNDKEVVGAWVETLREQVSRFLSAEGDNAVRVVNNLDWTAPMSAIDFLRDIGKHYRVNKMITKEAVAARLNSQDGISYTEFSYQMLQGLDFLELYRQYGCTLQTGGSDQWGNLTSGTDLIQHAEHASVHLIATPLVTKADGTKYGKTEGGGTVWLGAELMSPYAFFQFWLNVEDASVGQMLRIFTFRSRGDIEALEESARSHPQLREGQRALAREVTSLVHGAIAAARAEQASQALFGSGELAALDDATLRDATAELPSAVVRRVEGDPLPSVLDLLTETGLSPSRSAARRAVAEGGAYVNNQRVTDEGHIPTDGDLLAGRWLLLRRGKRHLAAVEVVDAAADLPSDSVAMP